jgi:geranylgeranyl pyrophosphate synthase
VLVDSGALAEIEALVDELTGRAIDAIEAAEIAPEARDELVELARYVASRDA